MQSKIKEKDYFSSYKDNILIQKYEDKKNIYFARNYLISKDSLRENYNITNREVDAFDNFLKKEVFKGRLKNGI